MSRVNISFIEYVNNNKVNKGQENRYGYRYARDTHCIGLYDYGCVVH